MIINCFPGVLAWKGGLRPAACGTTSTSLASSSSSRPPVLPPPGVVASDAARASTRRREPPADPAPEAPIEGVSIPVPVGVVEMERGVEDVEDTDAVEERDRVAERCWCWRRGGMNSNWGQAQTDQPVPGCVEDGLISVYAKNCMSLGFVCREICEAKSALGFGFPRSQTPMARSQSRVWLLSAQHVCRRRRRCLLFDRPYDLTQFDQSHKRTKFTPLFRFWLNLFLFLFDLIASDFFATQNITRAPRLRPPSPAAPSGQRPRDRVVPRQAPRARTT